eukprot:TRINITY_DN12158_c0_g1_i1.p3 TRINITY_DN12158_c0_g1~~TRINITY_DN12158_c0_g1_i1.p3  ORF type:complete len:217 (-),score=41.99 TRINITY_DN12158_c0_g1_i1:569-1186(-)
MLGLDQYSEEEGEIDEVAISGESGLVVGEDTMTDTESMPIDPVIVAPNTGSSSEEFPAPPDDKVSEEIVQRILQLKQKQQEGIQLANELKKQKDYKNPDFLRKMVAHFQIEEYGSCLSKDVFDPSLFDERNYINNLQKEWKIEEAKRLKARQLKKGQVEFNKAATLKTPSKPPGLDTQEIIQKAKAQAEAGVKKMLRQEQQQIRK